MRIGELRERITLQTVTVVNDAYGGMTETVADYKEIWAKAQGLKGREYWSAKQINSERYLRFTVRYDSGITPQMRISYDSRTFEIEEVYDPEETGRFMTLLAVEQV